MSSQAREQLRKRTFHQDRWPSKTVDIGANGVTVSANPLGQIYQISSPLNSTNKFGIMVASPWPQFDHEQRTNPSYVREFRKIPEKLLMQRSNGLGLDFGHPKGPVVITPVHGSIGSHVQFEYRSHDGNLLVQTALKIHDDGTIVHASRVTNMVNTEQMIPVSLDLAFAVSRAGYGQLTDRGAVDMPNPSNVLQSFRDTNGAAMLSVENPSLGGRVSTYVVFYNETTGEYIEVQDLRYAQPALQKDPPHRLSEIPTQEIWLGPGETLRLAVLFRPEDILSSDQLVPVTFPEVREADEIAPDDLFSHPDGLFDSRDVGLRHTRELFGFNRNGAETTESTILWANLDYILGCCCVPMSGSEGDGTCCIADHFALNLGWPRDNYWQMRLLRMLDSTTLTQLLPNNPENASQYDDKIRQALTNHLFWLFQMAVTQIEVNGEIRHFWRRSYLVNGNPKDGEVFQLDTQCYPFLELCEYFEAYGDEAETVSDIQHILRTDSFNNILWDLLSRRDSETDLFSSDETPADDDLGDYKFHLSSNILLWHTLCKLSELLSQPQFEPHTAEAFDHETLESLATKVRESILENFRSCQTFNFPDGQQIHQVILAYGFDPSRRVKDPMRYRHYHDGNDMPTLYAQEWGFLKSDHYDEDDPDLWNLWKNTMVWAFTPGPARAGFNSGYQGDGSERFHGLGSDHSPGPWTLGFFQEWRFAQMVGDKARERKAWRQIEESAQFDGTFSEAVDIHTGVCTSKTWFSWPGAMIAENLIDTVIEQVEQAAP